MSKLDFCARTNLCIAMGCAPTKQVRQKKMDEFQVGETVHCMIDSQNHTPSGHDGDKFFVGTVLQKTPEMEAQSIDGPSTNVRKKRP